MSEIEQDSGEPDGAAEERPLAAQAGEEQDDGEGEEGRDGAFGEGGGGSEEVEIEEPEFFAGFVPGVPAEHADAEGRGELHVGGGSAGEGEDADAGGGDEGGVEVASGAESAHVEVDEDDEGERSGGGGEAGGPVGDAELLEEAHGAPVVEGGLFEPGLAVEDGGDGSADEAVVGVAEGGEGEAAGNDLGVDFVAGVGVGGEHLAGDLGVAGLVCADEAELVASEEGNEAVEEEEAGDGAEDEDLAGGDGVGELDGSTEPSS